MGAAHPKPLVGREREGQNRGRGGREGAEMRKVCFIGFRAMNSRVNSTRFLSRVNILTRDIDIANLSVCPSVCLYIHPSMFTCTK